MIAVIMFQFGKCHSQFKTQVYILTIAPIMFRAVFRKLGNVTQQQWAFPDSAIISNGYFKVARY